MTHQTGCNALFRLLTGAPALQDIGMASLTLAMRQSHEQTPFNAYRIASIHEVPSSQESFPFTSFVLKSLIFILTGSEVGFMLRGSRHSISQSGEGNSKSYRRTRVAMRRGISVKVKLRPVQARGPRENGTRHSFHKGSAFGSSHRSGRNADGSGKIEALWCSAKAETDTVVPAILW